MTAVTFHATEADYTAASRDAYLVSLRRPRTLSRLVIVCAIVLMVLATFLYAVDGYFDPGSLFVLPWVLVAIPLGVTINLLWLPRKVRRMFRQQPAYAEPMTCRWSDEWFGMTTPLSTVDLRWDQVYGWHETASSLLFYITDFQLIFVPKRVLPAADLHALRTLLSANVRRH